jgi:hypothetical protein
VYSGVSKVLRKTLKSGMGIHHTSAVPLRHSPQNLGKKINHNFVFLCAFSRIKNGCMFRATHGTINKPSLFFHLAIDKNYARVEGFQV